MLPNSWTNRKTGESKLKVKEMGSRYLSFSIVLSKNGFQKGDYRRKDAVNSSNKIQNGK